MPSKGGRRSNAVLAEVAAPPPASLDATALGLDPALIERPLHRGHEVERFRELAGRQAELNPAESDELYRYRLQRLAARERALERAAGGESEQELRGALDDHARRLRELRSFEEQRRQAGLQAGYAVDPGSERRARERLAELAGRRPHGLVAGGGPAPSGADQGAVRLPERAFSPTPEDAPVYLLSAPATRRGEALAGHVRAVAGQGADLHLVHDVAEIPRDRPCLVLNWGSDQGLPQDLVLLNRPEAVRVSADQVESLRRLGELAPRTVLNPQDVHLLGGQQVVAKRRLGTRGSGKRVLSAESGSQELAGYDLYQEFLARRREYRVSLLSGRVVSAYLRRPPEGTRPEDLRPAWTFERATTLPSSVVAAARSVARRIGLDYAGVDVVQDLDSGRVLCLEANAAPGMSEETLRSLYGTLQQILRRPE